MQMDTIAYVFVYDRFVRLIQALGRISEQKRMSYGLVLFVNI